MSPRSPIWTCQMATTGSEILSLIICISCDENQWAALHHYCSSCWHHDLVLRTQQLLMITCLSPVVHQSYHNIWRDFSAFVLASIRLASNDPCCLCHIFNTCFHAITVFRGDHQAVFLVAFQDEGFVVTLWPMPLALEEVSLSLTEYWQLTLEDYHLIRPCTSVTHKTLACISIHPIHSQSHTLTVFVIMSSPCKKYRKVGTDVLTLRKYELYLCPFISWFKKAKVFAVTLPW